MEIVFVDDHAFKHGLSEVEIRYAWEHFLKKQYRGAPREGQILAVGYCPSGRLLQMVAVTKGLGVLIYHAMSPPTRKALVELGLVRGR